MRTSSRVSSVSSEESIRASAASRASAERRGTTVGLLVREGQDDRVEADDAVLLARDVEVVALDLLGRLLERHAGLEVRHLAERVGALVEAVAARDDLAVADRRAPPPARPPPPPAPLHH